MLESPESLAGRKKLAGWMTQEIKQLWKLPQIGDIRQVGLVVGIELVKNWKTREPFPLRERAGIRVCEAMAMRGVLTRPIGNVVVVMPPYCATRRQVRKIFSALSEAVEEVWGKDGQSQAS